MKTISLILFNLFAFLLVQTNSVSAQEKVLQSSRILGEADFHFEVLYKVIDCGDGAPTIMLTAFNESGAKTDVAFDIVYIDKKTGVKQEVKVPFFYIKPFDMISATCGSNKYLFLKHKLNKQIDYANMDVNIKFYSK